MWDDLREHIGTVVFLLGTMSMIVAGLLRILWGWVRKDLDKFPQWLTEMDKDGGVVTHKQLEARAIGMTVDDHEIICGKVTIMVLARVEQSEKHQRELLVSFEKQFQALVEGQGKLIDRLAEIQDVVLAKLNSMPQK